MGIYLNPGSGMFRRALNSEIYVDKTGLIGVTNRLIGTEQCCLCVSRPRRFGKSMGLNMLVAYYGRGTDSDALFASRKAATYKSYHTYLNRFNVLRINMQELLSMSGSADRMTGLLKSNLMDDLKAEYPEYVCEKSLVMTMKKIYAGTGCAFVILIDEWDCLFRENAHDVRAQKNYLDFLRMWLKDQEYVALAYMTGILPIKKYGTHSALNMFSEYSMTNSGAFAEYFGFTENEVRSLCEERHMSFTQARSWYDGYTLPVDNANNISVYNPRSVVEAMRLGLYDSYWNQTETYEALKAYIQMNIDGLKDDVITMLAGGSVRINTGSFANDMTSFSSKDDVLTLLVHLGYLSYNWFEKRVMIPNREVSEEYITAIQMMPWSEVTQSVENSRKLLEALWELDGEAVARGIDKAHNEISILKYNDENSLSCTINLAFYYAREYYSIVRELPAGKGFADICFIPKMLYADKPAVIIELKWNQDADGAINQIKKKSYLEALKDYHGNLLLAGINYDKKAKIHDCVIEKIRI